MGHQPTGHQTHDHSQLGLFSTANLPTCMFLDSVRKQRNLENTDMTIRRTHKALHIAHNQTQVLITIQSKTIYNYDVLNRTILVSTKCPLHSEWPVLYIENSFKQDA